MIRKSDIWRCGSSKLLPVVYRAELVGIIKSVTVVVGEGTNKNILRRQRKMTTAMLESPMVSSKIDGKEDIQLFIEEKLGAFDAAIEGHGFLEIDGDIPGNTPKEDSLKIINHKLECAFAIDVDSVIRQDLKSVIHALETGITTRLYGVTRIVGYYSRVSNWNKSKIGELHDRHMGKYSVR